MEQEKPIAGRLHSSRCWLRVQIINASHHANGRRRVDGPFRMLVVEGDVSARYGCAERRTRIAHPLNSFSKSPVDLGLVRIAKVQAVGNSYGAPTCTHHISGGFADSDLCSLTWIQVDISPVAVGFERQAAVCAFDAHDCCIARARPNDGVGTHHRVVLLENPALRRNIGSREQIGQSFRCRIWRAIRNRFGIECARGIEVCRTLGFSLINGRTASRIQMTRIQISHKGVVPIESDVRSFGDRANAFGLKVPLPIDADELFGIVGITDDEHPLLAL